MTSNSYNALVPKQKKVYNLVESKDNDDREYSVGENYYNKNLPVHHTVHNIINTFYSNKPNVRVRTKVDYHENGSAMISAYHDKDDLHHIDLHNILYDTFNNMDNTIVRTADRGTRTHIQYTK